MPLCMTVGDVALRNWDETGGSDLELIRQFYIVIEKEEWLIGTLCDPYDTFPISQTIIFGYARWTVVFPKDQMEKHDSPASTMPDELDLERLALGSARGGTAPHGAKEALEHNDGDRFSEQNPQVRDAPEGGGTRGAREVGARRSFRHAVRRLGSQPGRGVGREAAARRWP